VYSLIWHHNHHLTNYFNDHSGLIYGDSVNTVKLTVWIFKFGNTKFENLKNFVKIITFVLTSSYCKWKYVTDHWIKFLKQFRINFSDYNNNLISVEFKNFQWKVKKFYKLFICELISSRWPASSLYPCSNTLHQAKSSTNIISSSCNNRPEPTNHKKKNSAPTAEPFYSSRWMQRCLRHRSSHHDQKLVCTNAIIKSNRITKPHTQMYQTTIQPKWRWLVPRHLIICSVTRKTYSYEDI